MAIDKEREPPPAIALLSDPQTRCLWFVTTAAVYLREAKAIAERLPNHGNLYFELEDAGNIIVQSLTRLLEARPDEPLPANSAIEYDLPPG
jgi:hypothetical protein